MSDTKGGPAAGASLLFLREEQIRAAQDLILLGYRDFAAAADPVLTVHGLGRAHQRAIHFIGRNPGITVSDLLGILGITKQSLARVLRPLIDKGLVRQVPGRSDRRQRLLTLTETGEALERQIFERQRERLVASFRDAGGAAVDGFRRVMRGILAPPGRAYLDAGDKAGRPR